MPIWKSWFAICFVLPFLILFPFFYIALRTKQYAAVFKLKRVWSYCICGGSFLFPKIKYQTNKYKLPRPCIIVPNHTSYLDIVFSPFYISHTAVYMGKVELLKIPLFNIFFKYLDIPVNRKSVTNAHRAFLEAGKKLDENMSMVIYAEGTISSDGALRSYKNGAFKLAIEKQLPIVPVVNLNNWWFLQNGGFFKSNGRPGIPNVFVGDAISTKGFTDNDINALKEKVYNFTKQQLDNYHGRKN
jgi:1-acyl-sn-glycerol-3-phosphate acyltransferase